MRRFLIAIQMGTTAYEEHVFNLVTSRVDGSGIIADKTKGVLIALTPSEVQQMQMSAPHQRFLPSTNDDARPTTKDGMAAFAERDYAEARHIFEALLDEDPQDEAVRRNLAAVLVTMGDKAAAHLVLGVG